MSVAIDAMIMIWGLKKGRFAKPGKAPPEIVELRRRSLILLETRATSKETVILPTVAVAEVLAGIHPRNHDNFLAELQERFFLPPFDLRAAALAAKLWQKRRGVSSAPPIERSVLKVDVKVVATAKVAGAKVLYSHDRGLRSIAEDAGLPAQDLPTHSENLFIDAESRRQAEEE